MKINLLSLFASILLVLCAAQAHGQYNIVYTDVARDPDTAYQSLCGYYRCEVGVNSSAVGLKVKFYFGDGTSWTSNVTLGSASPGVARRSNSYGSKGAYTLKFVLYNGTNPVDSIISKHYLSACDTNGFTIGTFMDLDNDCIIDTLTEMQATIPFNVEVSSAGIPIDTFITHGFINYTPANPTDTICSFRALPSANVTVTCPPSGIITDTFGVSRINRNKVFGVVCSGSAVGVDVAEAVWARAGPHHFGLGVLVRNNYCTPQNVTLTMHCSPKHYLQSSHPAPASVVGNTIIWNLSNVSAINQPKISAGFETPLGGSLAMGDTIHSDYTVTTPTGDLDPTNNYVIRVDTVKSGYDPNSKEVSPEGDIASGTQLTYTIHFENTGNDTAFNIHIMDTLSNKLDINSFKVLTSSAPMNVIVLKPGFGSNDVVKFDFPNINLLDSSHHGQNDGMLVYTINAKAGLSPGTKITNRAGIYFDYNPVVMTNTVQNQIPLPGDVLATNNTTKTNIYPNPVSTELTINTNSTSFQSFTITNTIGQQVNSGKVTDAQTKVDVRALPPGLYFLTLRGEGGVKVQQFQKL